MSDPGGISPVDAVGKVGIRQLKRFWSAAAVNRKGHAVDRGHEWQTDRSLLDALGLGLQQTMQYLYEQRPDFAEFEDWIVATAGQPDRRVVQRFNAAVSSDPLPKTVCDWLDHIESSVPVLTDDDLSFWGENGFVIVNEAVSPQSREAAEAAIWEYTGATPDDPSTWYQAADHGIMLELIQHPALQANRSALRIHKAFAQLWETVDLWASADRCGFHPPQRKDCPFPGPHLHWDVDFDKPLTFATQGILYLTDTPAKQGALSLVPGFHQRIHDWLGELAPGSDPNAQDLGALEPRAVGGRAGDLIIWHQLLPHGASPNLGSRPRIVQYINMQPLPGVIDLGRAATQA